MRNPSTAAPVAVPSILSLLQPLIPRGLGNAVRTALVVLMALAIQTAGAPAQTSTVSPIDRSGLEGSSSSSYPLGRHNCRYQQLYSDLGGQLVIRGQGFRRDALGNRGEIKSFRSQISISLSQVSQLPNKISKTFADNIGAKASVVFPRGWVSFPTTKKPMVVPASFEYRIPYTRPYTWTGKGTLALDMTIYGNQLATGSNKTFSASLDSHRLYASGRNLQPGYRFGSGCPASGASTAAWCAFELRHEGAQLDLSIDSRWGVPSTAAGPAKSFLLLSLDQRPFPWPPGSSCQVYGRTDTVVPLSGDNLANGSYKTVLNVGVPPPVNFEMNGQIISFAAHSGEVVLSDASRLITPPAGRGIVSARVIHASDRGSLTGTVSTTVPVCLFY